MLVQGGVRSFVPMAYEAVPGVLVFKSDSWLTGLVLISWLLVPLGIGIEGSIWV
jgi:hypothetical protein